MIRLDEDVISVEDFNYLTDKVGWGTRDANVVEEALNNTLYSVSIYDDNKELFEEYNLAKTYQEKRKLRKKIEKLSTSISSNQARLLKGRMFSIGLEDIKGIDTKYSNEVGLVLKQSLEDDIESRSL